MYKATRPMPRHPGACGGILGAQVSPFWGVMALTDIQAKAAKPADKPYKLAYGKGLYL